MDGRIWLYRNLALYCSLPEISSTSFLPSFYSIGSRDHKYKIMSLRGFANVSTEKKGEAARL